MPENSTGGRSVLLAGIARSGTTWVANALSHCRDASLVHEPDNDRHHVHAMAAKARLGRYPVLRPGDRAAAYADLFRTALTDPAPDRLGDRRRLLATRLAASSDGAVNQVMGDPEGPWPWSLRAARVLAAPIRAGAPPPGPRIVKTVHAPLALDWLLGEVQLDAAFVVVRHPANVIGSWRDLGWDLVRFPWNDRRAWDAYGPPGNNPGPGLPESFIERGAWHFALVANALLMAAEAHDLPVVDHEDLLDDAPTRLAGLAATLGLDWTDEAATWVRERDQPGNGYEIERVAVQERDRWRTRLTESELAVVAEVISRFPLLRERWNLTPRPVWTVGPPTVSDADAEGWFSLQCDVDGTTVGFDAKDVRPAARPEAVLTFLIPPAIAAGADLQTSSPVDATWVDGVSRAASVLAPWLHADATPTVLGPAVADGSAPVVTGRTGLCFTGGVDSFWSLLHGGHAATDLVYVWGYDLPLDDRVRGAMQGSMLDAVARRFDLGLVHVRTTARRHPHVAHVLWGMHHGAGLAAVGIALSDHLDRLVVPPSYPSSSSIEWGSSARLDPLWSVPGAIEIVHPVSELDRFERVLAIADDPMVHEHLRVCWERLEPGVNCGRCEKCLRTMVMFAGAGTLELVQTFPRAGDLPAAIAALAPLPPHSISFWEALLDERVPAELRTAVRSLIAESTVDADR